MSHTFETVAWIHGPHGCWQTGVIVHYEIEPDGSPDIWDVVEAADPENSLRSLLVENEEQLIYSKLEREIAGTLTDAAEMIFEMER